MCNLPLYAASGSGLCIFDPYVAGFVVATAPEIRLSLRCLYCRSMSDDKR